MATFRDEAVRAALNRPASPSLSGLASVGLKMSVKTTGRGTHTPSACAARAHEMAHETIRYHSEAAAILCLFKGAFECTRPTFLRERNRDNSVVP